MIQQRQSWKTVFFICSLARSSFIHLKRHYGCYGRTFHKWQMVDCLVDWSSKPTTSPHTQSQPPQPPHPFLQLMIIRIRSDSNNSDTIKVCHLSGKWQTQTRDVVVIATKFPCETNWLYSDVWWEKFLYTLTM